MMMYKGSKLHKLITAIATVVFFWMQILTAHAAVLDTVSLEQNMRCGRETHVHTDACYRNNILRCEIKEHIHSVNCYIVLMQDNDVDLVLNETEKSEEKTLENVIQNAVDSALVYNKHLNSEGQNFSSHAIDDFETDNGNEAVPEVESEEPVAGSLGDTKISVLNQIIREEQILHSIIQGHL